MRVGFWNVAGLRNKDKDFWKSLEKFEGNSNDRNMGGEKVGKH